MKQITTLLLASLFLFSSCSYDDNDVWDNINDLKNTDLNIKVESDDLKLIYGESVNLQIIFTAVESYSISKPDGWKVSIENEILTIESPSLDNKFADKDGKVTIIALDSKNKTVMTEIAVMAIYKTSIVTFEDETESTYWASLIDTPQYGGPLLYGDYEWVDYEWTDKESQLYSTINGGDWGKVYWSGGIAISNYYSEDLKANGDYRKQLTVYGTTGNNNSKNCGVAFTYCFLSFADKIAKTIDHMYIAPTTYYYYVAVEGNELSKPVGKDESVWIKATGYTNGVEGKTTSIYMIKNGKSLVDTWTKWDLSMLGKIDEVKFTMGGETDNGHGFSIPAYFAMDDISIIHN